MKRLIIGAAAVVVAAVPAVIGLWGNSSFAQTVPVRVPDSGQVLELSSRSTPEPTDAFDDNGGDVPRDQRVEPGDDRGLDELEPGDDHGGMSGSDDTATDDHGGTSGSDDTAADDHGGTSGSSSTSGSGSSGSGSSSGSSGSNSGSGSSGSDDRGSDDHGGHGSDD